VTRRGVLLTLGALIAIGAIAAWWFYTFERVEEDVAAPLRGEARYNPLFGLKKALEARGIAVESRPNLNIKAMALGDDDTLILDADVRSLSAADAGALVDWIEDGGSLVFALPPGAEGRGGELIDALDLSVVAHTNCLSWPLAGKEKAEHCFHFAFIPKADEAKEFDVLLGTREDGYYLGRRSHGDGDWTALGDLHFLHTTELKRPGYAEFAWQVLSPVIGEGKVHLVYAADVPPLYVLLVKRGWPALVPALLALLAWFWARSQRFGPLLPLAPADRRALREHIRAAGEFTFRRRRAAALYAPVRRAFDERLRRDDPALAALDGEALVAALAARSGHSPALVRVALNPFDLTDPERFFVTIKTLTELRTRP